MKTVFGAGPIKRIHVNQHVIRANKRDGAQDPPLSVKVGGRTLPAHDVLITGPSRVVYRPDKPLACGATVWVTTQEEIALEAADG
jgi:hypothetical protein